MKDRQHRSVLVTRVWRLNGLALAALLVIATSYGFVQVVEGAYFRELAENNRLRKISLAAPRGVIYDRNGRALVENVPSYNLVLDRSQSRNLEASLAFAAHALERPQEELEQVLVRHRVMPYFQPIVIASGLSLPQVARIGVAHLEHSEFEIEVEHVRLYRHAHQTAHILGYLGEVTKAELARLGPAYRPGDLVGKKGIERLHEKQLRGQNGEQVVVVDSRGRMTDELKSLRATPGSDIELTLDLELQQEANLLLEDKVGAIVAMDPRQGDILAMASSPSFNPNRFARRLSPEEWREILEDPARPLQNRALQNEYPPGSVFKILMALAGLDRGLVDPAATVYCRGASVLYNHTFRCWKPSGHGTVDLHRALQHSCNVYFHQMGQRLGIDEIAAYARRFGLGRPTGIDLAGERAGQVPDSRWSLAVRGGPWYPGETISVSTGQGPIDVTPIQMAVMMAAVANGGDLVQPHLVRRQRDAAPPPTTSVGISPRHLERVKQALWAVVNEPGGTASSARIDGLDVVGKTGTAQVVAQATRTSNEQLAPEHRDHAWFASFAPLADPRLVVVVFVEHGGGGSKAAAPLARALYEKFFQADLAHRSPA